jgi:hypothetical protein
VRNALHLQLDSTQHALMASLKQQPLVVKINDKGYTEKIREAATTASVDSFGWGLGIASGLVLLGGIISLFGIVNPKRTDSDHDERSVHHRSI